MKKIQPRSRMIAATVAGVVAALTLSACGSSDTDTAADGEVLDRTIKVGTFPTFNGLTSYVAQEQGFFEEEGLDVELVAAGAPAAMMPQLIGGSLDFAMMDLVTPIVARSQGVPILSVAPGGIGTDAKEGEKAPVGLWVRKDGGIKSVKELENSTFAVPAIGSAVWMDVREYVDNAGGDSSKIKFVEVQDQIGALLAGDVSASTSSEPRDSSMLGDKTITRLDNYLTMNGGLAYSFIATEKFSGANDATVDAFERAILKANTFIMENREELPAIAATYVDFPVEQLETAIYPQAKTTSVEESDIEAAIERMIKYELITEADAPDAADFVRD